MFSGGDPGAGYSPDPPTREKKIPFEFTFKHLVIFLVLFILILIIITLLEMAGKAQALAL